MLGEEDANAFMTEFPSIEADEVATKQFLRAELAELENRLLVRLGAGLGGAIGLSTAILGALIAFS